MSHREAIIEAFRKIPIGKGIEAIINESDYLLVSPYTWWIGSGRNSHTLYACATINGHKTKMHRLIMNATKGQIVDHINGCGIDNRRQNLRLCSHSQNSANMFRMALGSSRFKGVSWDKVKKRWFAKITVNYKQIALGRYRTEEDAARAYDAAAKTYFGKFANINLGEL